jgi:low temperature requirement protein LtrA
VFVAAVSQLGAALARDPSGPVFARFVALFVVVVWAWILYTLYANRFDTDDLVFRLAKSGGMLAIAAVAVNLHWVMVGHGGTVGFAIGYVVLRSLLIALYGRACVGARIPGVRHMMPGARTGDFTGAIGRLSLDRPEDRTTEASYDQ